MKMPEIRRAVVRLELDDDSVVTYIVHAPDAARSVVRGRRYPMAPGDEHGDIELDVPVADRVAEPVQLTVSFGWKDSSRIEERMIKTVTPPPVTDQRNGKAGRAWKEAEAAS